MGYQDHIVLFLVTSKSCSNGLEKVRGDGEVRNIATVTNGTVITISICITKRNQSIYITRNRAWVLIKRSLS